MSLMSNLFVGVSGLQTSQNALNTTAHNLSNIDTVGYTRQQVMQSDTTYNTFAKNPAAISYKQIGQGVAYSKVRQVRDNFLDQTYRKESGRSAFYSNSYQALSQVETIFGELYGATFNESMENIQRAIDELAKTPTDSVVQGLVIQRSVSFLESAQGVYQGLCDYQDNLNLQIQKDINTINEYGKKILELNKRIAKVEAGGVENANDLRDARNQILDELSSMARISYTEDAFGKVTVQLEGHDFVTGNMVLEIDLDVDGNTGFFTPFWKMDARTTVNADGSKTHNIEGAEVFKQFSVGDNPNSQMDIGGVKALLLARGTKRANYTDLQDTETYNKEIADSIIMNIQAEFDQLIHAVATTLNGILAEAADQNTGYLCEKVMVNGVETYQPIQLFQKRVTEGYRYDIDPADNKAKWIFNEEDPSETESLYSVMNLVVNPALIKEPTKLGLLKPDGKEDQETADKLAAAFQAAELHLNPTVSMKSDFTDYYSDLMTQIANTGMVLRKINENQNGTVEATCYAREQIMGVSSDEELTNMVKFQNAYNASSRYINVVDEMLEHLINSMAG